jgi:hypothetical protein
MIGLIKRLLGRPIEKNASATAARAAHSRPRSATGAVLAQGRRPGAPGTAPQPEAAKGKGGESEFDPYNTGKFDRAASWERVRHSHR